MNSMAADNSYFRSPAKEWHGSGHRRWTFLSAKDEDFCIAGIAEAKFIAVILVLRSVFILG